MKTVPLAVHDTLNTKDILIQVAKLPLGGAGGGITLEDMRADIRLLDKLEPASDRVELEDADWARLTKKLRAFPFAFSDRRLVEMCDSVLGASDRAPDPV